MSQIERIAHGPELPAATAALPHILFVLDGFPRALGGGERVALRLASLLPQYGFRASILLLFLDPDCSFRPEDAPCPVYLLPLTSAFGPQAWQGALALRRFLRQENVSLVQTFFESSDLWAGLTTRLLSRARLVWSRRDLGILRQRKHRIAYRLLHRIPHAVAAVSDRVAQQVITADRVPPQRVRVIYNGLDLLPQSPLAESMESLATRRDGPVIATVGNIRHVKGQDVLLESAAIVLQRHPTAVFVVAGAVLEPAFEAQLRQRVEELGLSRHFLFQGKISDLQSFLSSADVFVLPSRSEGFSNALVEAMAAGLPVVATDVGGNAEAVENDVSGWIVPPEDAGAMAKAINDLLDDPKLAAQFGAAAARRASERFSSDAMMRAVQELFTEVLKEKRRS